MRNSDGYDDHPTDGTALATSECLTQPPCVAIAKALADAEGVSPLELDIVLHDHVNTDALDNLLTPDPRNPPTDAPLTVELSLLDYDVTVTNDGSVRVESRR